jgi:peptidoglycan hydrolase-like protein with peptidoglycan-binding domain
VRLISAALAVALTPAFVALPTVSFAAADKPRPVAPSVVSERIGGIDPGAAASPAAKAASLAPAPTTHPAEAGSAVSATRHTGTAPKVSVLTGERSRKRFTVAGVSWARSTDLAATDVTVQMRVKEDTGWTGWETLSTPDDGPDSTTGEASTARVGTTPLVTNGATGVQVRVETPGGRPLPDVKVTTIDPGTSPADDDLTRATPAASASAAARQPTIITRAQWGADERLRGPMTLSSTVKSIVIHHTAGTNSYTEATAAAQVRGIYAYDTQGLGWADIAYNFLVDKWGRVYEGRAGSITLPVRGAHAMGFNTDTMGIAAMGNYETAAAPAVMVDALAKVAGWKLSQYGVNPLGTARLTSQGGSGTKYAAGVSVTLPAINAHQNTSYTLCPGKYLYPSMDTIRQKAALYASYSSTSAPAPVTTSQLYAVYGSLTLQAGSTGWAVRDLQLELNRRGFGVGTADGAFGPLTTAGVTAFQKAAQLPQTGRVTSNDWKALSGLAYTKVSTTPLAAVPGFNADGRGDVMGRTGMGDLYYYPMGVGAVGAPVRVGTGWGGFAQVVSPGDWNGDRFSDVLALTTTGDLYLYKGNGRGGFLAGRTLVARGWSGFTDLATPGDWTGDTKPDLLARKANGELWLVTGNGTGGLLASPRRIGTGWQIFTQLVTPGDVTGDRRPDLLGRTPAGTLYLYVGTGTTAGTATGYQPGKVLSHGWQVYNTVFSTGDVTGDGRADLVARTPGNVNYVYPGSGTGTFLAAKRLSVPWGATTRIFGVR